VHTKVLPIDIVRERRIGPPTACWQVRSNMIARVHVHVFRHVDGCILTQQAQPLVCSPQQAPTFVYGIPNIKGHMDDTRASLLQPSLASPEEAAEASSEKSVGRTAQRLLTSMKIAGQ